MALINDTWELGAVSDPDPAAPPAEFRLWESLITGDIEKFPPDEIPGPEYAYVY